MQMPRIRSSLPTIVRVSFRDAARFERAVRISSTLRCISARDMLPFLLMSKTCMASAASFAEKKHSKSSNRTPSLYHSNTSCHESPFASPCLIKWPFKRSRLHSSHAGDCAGLLWFHSRFHPLSVSRHVRACTCAPNSDVSSIIPPIFVRTHCAQCERREKATTHPIPFNSAIVLKSAPKVAEQNLGHKRKGQAGCTVD